MSTLAQYKHRVALAHSRARGVESRTKGKIAAAAGGAGAALVTRYLPQLIPGATFDHPAIWAVGLALDAFALTSKSNTVNAAAEGFTGYLTGKEVERFLP